MEELFIVKNLLSAAAFGAALIAERRRNRVAAHPAEEGEDAPLDTLQRVVQTAGDTPLADWPYDALWAAARRVGACCGACLSPEARSGTHLLRTFSDGAVGEHAAAALLHCEATREAQAQRA